MSWEGQDCLEWQEQLRRRFVKPALNEIGVSHRGQRRTDTLARAQAQRGLKMLDREIGLARGEPEIAAHKPTAGEARVERQRPVDQPDHRAGILTEATQHKGGVGEDVRVVIRRLERLPSKVDGPTAGRLRRFSPAVKLSARVTSGYNV
jgi:hypothetical protein